MSNPCLPKQNGGILNSLFCRERGLIHNSQYKYEVMNCKVGQFPTLCKRRQFQDDLFSCQFFRTGKNRSVVGVLRHYNPNESPTTHYTSIYAIQFVYNNFCKRYPSVKQPFLSSLKTKAMVRDNLIVADTADIRFSDQIPLLFVGNFYKGSSVAVATFFDCESSHRDMEWVVKSHINCCAGNPNVETFALGCDGGYYICKDTVLSTKYDISSNISAMDFHTKDGILFISSDKKGIEIYDIRSSYTTGVGTVRRNAVRGHFCIDTIGTPALTADRMKLLSDEVSLIVHDVEGELCKVDLRVNRPVFSYPEHEGANFHRPLSLNEDLDLICAVGRNKLTRLWSLNSGKLLWTHRVTVIDGVDESQSVAHACIIDEQRKWYIAVIQDETFIPVVPDGVNMI